MGQLGRIRHPQHSGHEQHQQPAKDRAELQHEPTENLAHRNLPRLPFQQSTHTPSSTCRLDNRRVFHATRAGQPRHNQTDFTIQQDHVRPLVQLPGIPALCDLLPRGKQRLPLQLQLQTPNLQHSRAAE